MKRKYIIAETREIEPKFYTLIFEIDNKYNMFQCAAYDLESAVNKAAKLDNKRSLKTLWWHFNKSLPEIQTSFKNAI
jgi:hypothetical protein